MSDHVFNLVLKETLGRKIDIYTAKFLIYGLTFKENCPDFRNSQSLNVYQEFKKLNLNINVYDPFLNEKKLNGYSKEDITLNLNSSKYSVIVFLVPHNEIKEENLILLLEENGFIFDLKNKFNKMNNIKSL